MSRPKMCSTTRATPWDRGSQFDAALKGRNIGTINSIPNISFIEIDVAIDQESAELFLERDLSMVYHLVLDIPTDRFRL
jgi:hypothetical protein